jgi:hypothetical protein
MIRWLALLAAFPTLAAAQKITMEFDQGSDFSRFKTFFINKGQLNAKNPALNNDLVRKQSQAVKRRGAHRRQIA